MKSALITAIACIASLSIFCTEQPILKAPNMTTSEIKKIKITIGEGIITASMYDNPTTRDFLSLLPLTLTMTDYNATEKICDLPKRLSTKDAPAGYKPSAGDITLYAPWGNLAVFYKDFSYSDGLILIGKIDAGADALKSDRSGSGQNGTYPIKANDRHINIDRTKEALSSCIQFEVKNITAIII